MTGMAPESDWVARGVGLRVRTLTPDLHNTLRELNHMTLTLILGFLQGSSLHLNICSCKTYKFRYHFKPHRTFKPLPRLPTLSPHSPCRGGSARRLKLARILLWRRPRKKRGARRANEETYILGSGVML